MKDIEMRSEQHGGLHLHVALVATEGDATPVVHARSAAAPRSLAHGVSLLRLSVPVRLLIVAVASALLWGAVLWALG
jgi:hypothetical protein